ncbi:MAG: SDR family oxidoreductase [Deltaproteobacteria bacterium]|nr:SDR family oxidoreductase [Deltaproteobacteria bacterium]
MERDKILLGGKVAIVTGARRGLGKAIALALAGAGADIAICDRVANDGEMESLVTEIKEIGCRAMSNVADITRKEEVNEFTEKVASSFGSIDILINNAAMNIRAPLLDLNEEAWDRVMNTDLKGHWLFCQAVGRKMTEQRSGNIINISSMAAFKAEKQMGAYCIAKSGVTMLTRVLALELAEYNIRVNAVAPFIVKTKFSQPLWNSPEVMKQLESNIPIGRLAETDDITGAVLFLTSDTSRYITGHTISIDGGLSA